MKHPVGFWATLGAMFRFVGMYACDYYGPFFYLRYYPEYATQFLTIFPLLVLTCGFSSSIAGGMICDRFGKNNPMTKSLVCVIG